MLTLYGSGPMFGLPDPCPFVLRTMTQLKMAGLPYRCERGGPADAPKGKSPVIRDGDLVLAGGVVVLDHLRRTHGVDLDAHLAPEQRAIGWALERMLEDHLYRVILRARPRVHESPAQGEAGACRRSAADIAALASRDFAAASAVLGEKPYLFGDRPSSADATLFAFTASAASPLFDATIREAAEARPNLVAHQWRLMDRFFEPAFSE